MKYILNISTLFVLIFASLSSSAQNFVHPGIDQTTRDLDHMRSLVLKGEQPWKAAYDRMKAACDTPFSPGPTTHVMRGAYGRPNIGGNELSRSANMAYNYALVWYITRDKKYADKAAAVLNAWSAVLWDFDLNDAKLLAAWTGHVLCNAAEILRHTNAGWPEKDQEQFKQMLMTVYYPLLRFYYPTANGNWDGAIIHTIMAMSIFLDDRNMFDNAVDHFLHAPVNGSLFKYIYPNGQCQESMRDQGHVQLGLGEFAGAAQVAYTQGVDLFSAGDNRLALGYEYTAGFLFGRETHCYGTLSQRAKELRDDYEVVYRHYSSKGILVPWTKKAADSVRAKASRSVLTAVRAAPGSNTTAQKLNFNDPIAGAGGPPAPVPSDAIMVSPGESVQEALNKAISSSNKFVVIKAGIHKLSATLKIPSGITMVGEGISSVLFLDPAGGRDAMVNAEDDMHDVTIASLVIECSNKTEIPSDPNSSRSYRGGYNRGGIIFRSQREGQMKNIKLNGVTVRNATYQGVLISGADNVSIWSCDFDENGGSVVPGAKLQHNLSLAHCRNVEVKGGRFDTSPNGSGIALDHCSDVKITENEIARNGYYGLLVSESSNVAITDNLIEANDRSGILVEYLRNGSEEITILDNKIQYNNGFGIESYAAKKSKVVNNRLTGNGNNTAQQKISNEKYILLN